MKVFVQVVDSRTGIYQTGMIDEPIASGFEITNAIAHFGVNINNVRWVSEYTDVNFKSKIGMIEKTTKILNVILL